MSGSQGCGSLTKARHGGSQVNRIAGNRKAPASAIVRRRIAIVAISAAISIQISPANPSPASAYDATNDFVTRNGSELQLAGRPYRFVGLNIYNANSDGWCWYQMDGGVFEVALDDIGLGADEHGVIRAWFFQPMATQKWTTNRDWTRFDRTLSAARARGYKVIVTLTDQWGECGDGGANGYKTQSWYETGYREPQPALQGPAYIPYYDWVTEVVSRYKDDATILAWQLINEAEVNPNFPGGCPAGDGPRDVLKTWAADVSNHIRSLDSNHLISLGSIGGGQCGMQSTQFKDVHDLPNVDLCEYHDYSPNQPMPGDQWNGLAVRVQQCAELDKPLFVGELGVRPNDAGGSFATRTTAISRKLDAQSAAGIDGHLVWAWNKDGPLLNNYDVGPGDPLLDLLDSADTSPFDPASNTEAVSRSSEGVGANGESGNGVGEIDISAHGRYVAFSSYASNLVAGDTNGTIDTFVRDRILGTTESVNASTTGALGDSWSARGAISGDGHWVAFQSLSSNLVPVGTPGYADVYVRDLKARTTIRLGAGLVGSPINVYPSGLDISGDGRFVAFASADGSLVAGDADNNTDTFVIDRDSDADGIFDEPGAQAISIASVATDGSEAAGFAGYPRLSSNGRFVGMFSTATGLVPENGPCPECSDAVVRDRDADEDGIFDEPGAVETRLVSVTSTGDQADEWNGPAYVANDGDAAFWTLSPNLKIGTLSGTPDVVVHEWTSGQTTVVGTGISNQPSISADGRFVAYDAFDTEYPGDTNNSVDVFVHDRQTASTARASLTSDGSEVALGGVNPALSADGRHLAFSSWAPNLVPGDSNGYIDVFVRDTTALPGGVLTPPGPASVEPIDATTGSTPITLNFGDVETPGLTTLTTASTGPTPPSSFVLGDPPTYFDISTTATFDEDLGVEVCIDYAEAGVTFPDESALRLIHYDAGTDSWSDITTSLDTVLNRICGLTHSFSPFAVVLRAYSVSRFASPADPTPTVNVSKAGSGIPIKFSLAGGNMGLAIFASGWPRSTLMTCGSQPSLDDIESTITAGSSSLSYDAASGLYTYTWKTDKAWANSCRRFVMTFVDGASAEAWFKFKK